MFLLGLIAILCAWAVIAWNRIEIARNEDSIKRLQNENSDLWKAMSLLMEDNEKLEEDNKKLWLEINTLFEMAEGVR